MISQLPNSPGALANVRGLLYVPVPRIVYMML